MSETATPAAPRPAKPSNLPHNIDAERAVLGAMLFDNEIIGEVSRLLKPEDFYEASHRVIFQRMLDLEGENQPIDLNLLADRLERHGELASVGDAVYLAQLEHFALSSSAAPQNAELVKEKSVLRRLIHASDMILREASAEKHKPNEVVEIAEKAIFEIGMETRSEGFRSFSELLAENLRDIEDLYNRGAPADMVQTGLLDLDKKLAGGFEKTALVILAARPSLGKTAFGLQLVRNIARDQKKPVAFFSLEMGAEQLSLRMLCSEAQVSNSHVRSGNLSEQDWMKIRQTSAELDGMPIFVDDQASISLVQLRSRARRLKAQHPELAMIVVDYLQLMSSPQNKRESNRQQEVAEISRGLKILAKELETPVMALSQLSRNVESRKGKENSKPMLSDLRESGAIEQDADVVMFIHRERVETDKDQDEQRQPSPDQLIPTEIIVAKNRNGPIGSVPFLFHPARTSFYLAS